MLQTIGCKNCGKQSLGLNSTWVDVTLTQTKWCEHCRNSKDFKQNYFFCSVECFNQYVKDHEIQWEN
jgi:hypothetical protein